MLQQQEETSHKKIERIPMTGEAAQPKRYASKEAMFEFVRSQLDAVIVCSPTVDAVVNMVTILGNLSALLFYAYNECVALNAELQSLPINWVGFYLVTQSGDSMSLGPFQGRVACTKIKVGRGVCGSAVLRKASVVVPNVHDFPGHIACDGDSNSEIVVPIFALRTDRRVVGVLDIDSTNLSQFHDDDRVFLEEVVRVLGERVDFPFRPAVRPLGAADGVVNTPPTPVHRTTTVEDLPRDAQLPVEVVPKVSTTRGWEFQVTEVNSIQSQAEQQQLEKRLGILALPEICFPSNAFRMVCPRAALALHFDVFSILQNAAAFHRRGGVSKLPPGAQVSIPCSPSWIKSQERFRVFDPKVDWAFRNDYMGLTQTLHHAESGVGDTPAAVGAESTAVPLYDVVEDDTATIDWELLKRHDVPIRSFGNLILFEDDLHDNGSVLCTVKFRVMDSCFFVLFRHVVYVHAGSTSVREVRVFYKFGAADVDPGDVVPHTSAEGAKRTPAAADPPLVIFEETIRGTEQQQTPLKEQQQDTPPAAFGANSQASGHHSDDSHKRTSVSKLWTIDGADALVPSVPLLQTKRFALKLLSAASN